MNNYKKTYPTDEYGYSKDNPRHQESNWVGRADPRDKPDSHMKFNNVYYGMIDRQIAADHHERTQQAQAAQGQGGQGSSSGSGSGGNQNQNYQKKL